MSTRRPSLLHSAALLVCAGASHGGDATLMGPVNDPALYKCGINRVGVTGINLLYSGHWSFTSDLSSNYLKYGAADRRVPLYHGKKFHDTVKATNPNVAWVVCQEEGHGRSLPKNRIGFWDGSKNFLAATSARPETIPVS